MKSIMFFCALLVLAMAPARAENRMPTLSERFDNCMNDPACEPAERMSILVQVSTELKKSADTMRQNCIDKNYKSCIGPKSPGTLQWYKMYGYLAELADSLEGSGMSERQGPGLPPEDRKIEPQWPSWYQADKVK